MSESNTVEQHFAGRPAHVRAIYDRLLTIARGFGDFREEPKKTSIHLARKSAFAGVATRKDAVMLTLKSSSDIDSPRIAKREQASANRWHLEVRLTKPAEVDAEVKRWLKSAFDIS
jgi:hypothetical protein